MAYFSLLILMFLIEQTLSDKIFKRRNRGQLFEHLVSKNEHVRSFKQVRFYRKTRN